MLVEKMKRAQPLDTPILSRHILFWTFAVIGAHLAWFPAEENILSFLATISGSAGFYMLLAAFFLYLGLVALFVTPKNDKHAKDLIWAMYGALVALNMLLCAVLALAAIKGDNVFVWVFAIAYAVQAGRFGFLLIQTKKDIRYVETNLHFSWICALTLAAVGTTAIASVLMTSEPVIQLSTILTIGTLILEFQKHPKQINITPHHGR